MNPVTFSEYSKKYGNIFLMWCAIGYLYTQLSEYKSELKEVREELYNCMELRAQQSKVHSIFYKHDTIYFDIPKKTRYGIKGNNKSLEI